ncbi:hypothetical protein SB6411_05333 [Klebsiella spallanzanii]|uniref:Uncharacterized protein n=1 Tax=Klebsiella spallanzanii TaxID=2587528 RepID=A0ABY6VB13_9ENTR|nr:hypothetical protein SB6411_05333 [Klebsiella spallanzanii]
MKPSSEIENNMNGALVIPKLICIKFYRIFFERTIAKTDKKSPQCVNAAGRGRRSAEGFKGFYSLKMRGDILEFVGLLFIPDYLIVMMQQIRRTLAIQRFVLP